MEAGGERIQRLTQQLSFSRAILKLHPLFLSICSANSVPCLMDIVKGKRNCFNV